MTVFVRLRGVWRVRLAWLILATPVRLVMSRAAKSAVYEWAVRGLVVEMSGPKGGLTRSSLYRGTS